MNAEPPARGVPVARLAGIRRRALARPDELTPEDAEVLRPALGSSDPRLRGLSVAALAAVAYGRAELVSPEHLVALVEGVGDAREAGAASELLQGLATTSRAPDVARAVGPLLGRGAGRTGAAEPVLHARAIEVLRALERWAPDTVLAEDLLDAASSVPAELREELLAEVVEPRLERGAPELTPATIDRLESLFGGTRRLRYTLHRLAWAPGTPPETVARAERRAEGRFPWRRRARELLGSGPFHLLVVQNVRMGQGDELIRVGLLLQGLLASLPRLRCTIVTPRPYLWDHPRLTAVRLGDRPAVDDALGGPWQGLFEIWEPRAPGVMLEPALHERLEAAAAGRSLALRLEGQLAWSHYVFERLELAGVPLAGELGVDRCDAFNVYDPALRLAAELGLPWLPGRGGGPGPGPVREPRPGPDPSPDPVAGSPSEDADRLWAGLRGAEGRPTALVNPFGGAWPAKGFLPERLPVLAREIEALVDEGFHAVVLPTGTPWCTPETMERLLHLVGKEVAEPLEPAGRQTSGEHGLRSPGRDVARDVARHVVVAPDPAREVGGLLAERPDLPWADRVMRLFLHWARRADLVVTVEGWLAHRAAQVGTPVRLVPMARSHGFDWQPMVPVERSTTLSPGVPEPPEPLSGSERPFPRRPRSHLLPLALEAPGDPEGRGEDLALVRHALGLHDPRLAARVASVLARYLPDPGAVELLRETLEHPEPRVRGAVAACLLRLPDASLAAAGLRKDRLRVHRDIACQRWDRVAREGEAAMPLLARAARDSDELLAREAEWMLGSLLARRVARRAGSR